MSRAFSAMPDWLGTSAEFSENWLKKLFGKRHSLGSYFSTEPNRLREIAARRGVHHVDSSFQRSSAG